MRWVAIVEMERGRCGRVRRGLEKSRHRCVCGEGGRGGEDEGGIQPLSKASADVGKGQCLRGILISLFFFFSFFTADGQPIDMPNKMEARPQRGTPKKKSVVMDAPRFSLS